MHINKENMKLTTNNGWCEAWERERKKYTLVLTPSSLIYSLSSLIILPALKWSALTINVSLFPEAQKKKKKKNAFAVACLWW